MTLLTNYTLDCFAMLSKHNILSHLSNVDELNSLEFSRVNRFDHQAVIGVIKSLEQEPDLIKVDTVTTTSCQLTAEGEHVVEHGSHEYRAFMFTPEGDAGVPQSRFSELDDKYAQIGLNKALSLGWLRVTRHSDTVTVSRNVGAVQDSVQRHLLAIQDNDVTVSVSKKAMADYKKRKLIQNVTTKVFVVTKGAQFSTDVTPAETELTCDLLAADRWRSRRFKPYNFEARGSLGHGCGHLHPLLKIRAHVCQILLEMGFSEMPTNRFVESSFWNFDALFQPQQHPARDSHDTFFVHEPSHTFALPCDYARSVKQVHSEGGYGSCGYGYSWRLAEAQKNVLRTHTTAVTARMLYQAAREQMFGPLKYFSIDRVFRNETLDATHLAEFHQVEGVMLDKSLTLAHLKGVIRSFFSRMGIARLRFKPAYNPYTEPSMEVFGYHEGLGKWVEVGNSGMFRPEMLQAMGFPANVNAIAWGLSLERPAMIKYKIDNIRDLCGNKMNLNMVYNNPICRLDRHERTHAQASTDTTGQRREQLANRLDRVQASLDGLQLMLEQIECPTEQIERGQGGVTSLTAEAGAEHYVLHLPAPAQPVLGWLLRLFSQLPRTCRLYEHVHSACAPLQSRPAPPGGSDAQLVPAPPGDAQLTQVRVIHLAQDRCQPCLLADGRRVAVGTTAVCKVLALLLNRHLAGFYAESERQRADQWVDCALCAVCSDTESADTAAVCYVRELTCDLVTAVRAAVRSSAYLLGERPTLADLYCLHALQTRGEVTDHVTSESALGEWINRVRSFVDGC